MFLLSKHQSFIPDVTLSSFRQSVVDICQHPVTHTVGILKRETSVVLG